MLRPCLSRLALPAILAQVRHGQCPQTHKALLPLPVKIMSSLEGLVFLTMASSAEVRDLVPDSRSMRNPEQE